MSDEGPRGQQLHEFTISLDADRPTASLMRLVGLVHSHGADLHEASFHVAPRTSRATAVLAIAGRPERAAALGRKLRRMVETIDVVGPCSMARPADPEEVSSMA
jgi:hypothetical protein